MSDFQSSNSQKPTPDLGFLWFSPEYLKRKTYFSKILRRLRRVYFGFFKKEYVNASIAAKREGDCNRCGACCALLYQCPFLGKDSENLYFCRIHGNLQPHACKNYPFDAVDSEVEDCTFKFKK